MNLSRFMMDKDGTIRTRIPMVSSNKLIITYPKRGNPPPVPEGFEPEPGDPFVLRKIWPICVYHAVADCGSHICGLLAKKIDQNVCEKCPYRHNHLENP